MNLHLRLLSHSLSTVIGCLLVSTMARAEEPPLCRAMSLGARWACCATRNDLRCAARPDEGGGARGAISEYAFASRATVRFREQASAQEVDVAGDAVCVLTGDGRVRCHPDLRRPTLSWTAAPGAYFAWKGGQTSSDEPPALCGIRREDESIACFRLAGARLEPIGTVPGRFRGVRVGAHSACGVDQHEDTVCWSLPLTSSVQPLATTIRLAASEGQVLALDLWDDTGCAVLKRKGVHCWQGASDVRKLRVPIASAIPAALRLGERIACITFQFGREIRCWKRGATIWDGTPLPERHTGVSEAFVGAKEACTIAWLGEHMECWDESNVAIPHVAEAPLPPPPSPPPPPPPPPPHWETNWAFHGAIPFSYGAGWYRTRTGTSQGSWLRFRAVAAWGPETTSLVDDRGTPLNQSGKRHNWAVGPYAEIAWHRVAPARQLAWGAGAIGILWISKHAALMPTVGWYQQDHADAPGEHGMAVGLGLDNASRAWGPLMLPIGLRVEARHALGGGGERAFLMSGEAD
ncbi:MAG TPA: hypothetical protein VHU40_05185, partial [Polyangia bacterium]|nr:hypothetical protein [Polyangia bacterium]